MSNVVSSQSLPSSCTVLSCLSAFHHTGKGHDQHLCAGGWHTPTLSPTHCNTSFTSQLGVLSSLMSSVALPIYMQVPSDILSLRILPFQCVP